MRPIRECGDLIAPADAFDIFSVMLTEHPPIFDKKFFLRVTACAFKIAFQRDNPGIISECLNLAHFPTPLLSDR
jgi:hypothetical protein